MKTRPTSITVICILGFIGAGLGLLALPLILSAASQFPVWYMPYLLLSMVIGATLLVGLWKMKRWGAIGYTGFTIFNQLVLLVGGLWSVMSLIIPAIVVGIALSNLKDMD
ncbi:MAG: hypothetical protein ACYC8T_00380 [Myxococcaceae bacterium]